MFQKIKSGTFAICNDPLVGPARENWNYIFSDLQLLCEHLEELNIEAIMESFAHTDQTHTPKSLHHW